MLFERINRKQSYKDSQEMKNVSGFFYVHTHTKDNKRLLRLICSLSLQFKMKSNIYLPQSYKSAANRLKSACLHYVTKTGCKYSTLLNIVLQFKKVLQYNQVCKFAIRPKNCIGLGATERFRVKTDRTIRAQCGRTIQG